LEGNSKEARGGAIPNPSRKIHELKELKGNGDCQKDPPEKRSAPPKIET